MATFPSLTQGPGVQSFVEEVAVDPTLRSTFENGKICSRARFTAVPKRWKFVIAGLTPTDKSTLQAFETDTVNFGGDAFDWENTDDGTTYSVKFAKPVKYSLDTAEKGVPIKRWVAEIELFEASPTS